MFSFQELQTGTYLQNSFFELWSGTALFRSLIHFYSTIFDKFMIQGWAYLPNRNEVNNIFHQLGNFYPFSIFAKSQTLSEFEAILAKSTGKKDNSKDK